MKLGDKDYWQIGDKVFSTIHGKGQVIEINDEKGYPIVVSIYKDDDIERARSYSQEGFYHFDQVYPVLFHLNAITFDEQDRPITINYDYVPKRTTKVLVTKLPHEFVEGEEVLVKDSIDNVWCYVQFSRLLIDEEYPYYSRIHGSWRYCIPYKGNEHCSCKITNCDSGKIPDDYVFPEPKEEIFRKAKLGDTIYRLYEGEFIEGKVVNAGTYTIRVETSSEATYKEYFGTTWAYNFYGELEGQEEIGQVLFWDNPNKSREHTFKPFDKVLVRMNKEYVWRCAIFSHYNEGKEFCTTDCTWVYCIPFEGNEHLLGATNNPKG